LAEFKTKQILDSDSAFMSARLYERVIYRCVIGSRAYGLDDEASAIIHPLLLLRASLSRQELAQQVTYLKTENNILRSKLPDRIRLNHQERRRLVKLGLKLGARIKDLISVASYSTFRRWVRAMEDAHAKPQSSLRVSGKNFAS
jgi:hypothetical protein